MAEKRKKNALKHCYLLNYKRLKNNLILNAEKGYNYH